MVSIRQFLWPCTMRECWTDLLSASLWFACFQRLALPSSSRLATDSHNRGFSSSLSMDGRRVPFSVKSADIPYISSLCYSMRCAWSLNIDSLLALKLDDLVFRAWFGRRWLDDQCEPLNGDGSNSSPRPLSIPEHCDYPRGEEPFRMTCAPHFHLWLASV